MKKNNGNRCLVRKTRRFELRQVAVLFFSLVMIFVQGCHASDEAQADKWIEGLFPSMSSCTPQTAFYFDASTKRSNNGLLERKGYSPYKVDAHTARYKIREKFFGIDAVEIAIPSSTDSVYAVTVSASVKLLSKAVLAKTGKKLRVVDSGFRPVSGVAYLATERADEAMFVCFTFEE